MKFFFIMYLSRIFVGWKLFFFFFLLRLFIQFWVIQSYIPGSFLFFNFNFLDSTVVSRRNEHAQKVAKDFLLELQSGTLDL